MGDMTNASLLSSTWTAPARERRMSLRNTVIEDMPQVSIRRVPPKAPVAKSGIVSPMSDDFPTPRAIPSSSSSVTTLYPPVQDVPASPASSDTQSDRNSTWSQRSSRSEFDELYDLSSSENEDFPIKLSSSVKRRVASVPKSRFPSIVIPSPSQWPTIQKLKSATTPLSPGQQVQLSPAVLAHFQDRNLRVPNTTSAPSLDGSMTSEELALSSCPSTPDITQHDTENVWEASIQLEPSAITMLQHLNTEEERPLETVIEVPEEAVSEMREIVESPRFALQLKTDDQSLEPSSAGDADDELSALSVPSPGGFFSSIDASLGRRTWSGSEVVPNTSTAAEFYGVPFRPSTPPSLPTSTATSFYGVPWAKRPENPVEHTVALASPLSDRQDPITARRGAFSPSEVITEVDEIDETYQDNLEKTASANIDRTQLWLCTQKAYIDNLCSDDEVIESFRHIDGAVPTTPDRPTPPSNNSSPQSKKSVRFVESSEASEATEEKIKKRISPIHDGTFWAGFKHTKRSQRARDVFQHRQMRAEAEHVRRNSAGKQHAEQLQGKFELTAAIRPSQARPISSFLPAAIEDDEQKEIIACAERERQALQQLQPSTWHTDAKRELHGGALLTSPIVATFKNRSDVRILDLGGQAHCSWAWDVATSHPQAQVFTTVSTDAEAHVLSSSLEGPMNHSVVAAPRTWCLPFPPNHFDVVSARTLYSHLRTLVPNGEVVDEWDLTLQECLRVLKPGGYLEFDLLDAELVHPDAAAQALGVEFSFKLRTRGYDPASGKTFLPRLKRSGFQEIKRAWMVLPVADVSPTWTDTGKSTVSSGSSTSTVVAAREEYFGPERSISPTGDVVVYEPPLTGSTKDVRAITGLVGARAWEQWLLKLACEMGREEEEGLEGVGRALDSAGRGDGRAGWRCLVGWARKAC
ncbi:hypothetical protein WHR41_08220 [Cladosporium halotolerans]|uniref:Methyltransferase type 11 domain-containing protein n=1 Tax=Cladosporium halotolerans TaxID=1052096 RepID=A0AB34KGS2_9PEZI